MSNQAHLQTIVEEFDPFTQTRLFFHDLLDRLEQRPEGSEADLERFIGVQGRELQRLLLQDMLDLNHARESKPVGLQAEQTRTYRRNLESDFGTVRVPRAAYLRPGIATFIPLDKQLRLPTDKYSLPVREKIALGAAQMSFDKDREQVQATTAAHIPKRQTEQLAQRAAKDVDSFYQQRPLAANDIFSPNMLLVASADSKGVTMRPEALRDSTRKAAEKESKLSQSRKDDPMAAKKLRKHDRRMAIVTAVFEQEKRERTAADVLEELTRQKSTQEQSEETNNRGLSSKKNVVRTVNKVVKASIEKSQEVAIRELFSEAKRLDRENQRSIAILVDGEEKQQREILKQAHLLGWVVVLIVDLIHVLHYLWMAAKALCKKGKQTAEQWVTRYTEMLLTGVSMRVILSEIRQEKKNKKLIGEARKAVDRCLRYLRKNAKYLKYNQYLKNGLPIATGVIEGACRYLVKDRMDITGARWGLEGAEAILKLRYVKANGDWNAYWEHHEQQEFLRNYCL